MSKKVNLDDFIFNDFTDTTLDKITCKKIWKFALLKCHIFLTEKVWNASIWISKINKCWGLIGDKEHNSMFQLCHRGACCL